MRIESLELFLSVVGYSSVSRTAKTAFHIAAGVSSSPQGSRERAWNTPVHARRPQARTHRAGRAIASSPTHRRFPPAHAGNRVGAQRTQRRKTSVPSRFLPRRSPRQHSKNCSSITKRQRPERDCASPNATCSRIVDDFAEGYHRHVARRQQERPPLPQSSAACRAWTETISRMNHEFEPS